MKTHQTLIDGFCSCNIFYENGSMIITVQLVNAVKGIFIALVITMTVIICKLCNLRVYFY